MHVHITQPSINKHVPFTQFFECQKIPQIKKYATLDFVILCVAYGRGLNVFPEAFVIVSCVSVAFLRRKDYEMNKMRSSCNEFVYVEGGVTVLVWRTLIERQQ